MFTDIRGIPLIVYVFLRAVIERPVRIGRIPGILPVIAARFADSPVRNAENIITVGLDAVVKDSSSVTPVFRIRFIIPEEPDMPDPSDFCNKIRPIIITATIINNTNKIENISYPYVCCLR